MDMGERERSTGRRALGSVVLALLTTAGQVMEPPCALACACESQRSPRQELESADAVFTGVVTRVQRFEKTRQNMNRMTVTQIYVVHFTPKRIWKGPRQGSIQVEAPDPEYDDCGIDFTSGEEYLVYAAGGDKLTTDRCHRTKAASQAAEDLSALGEPR